MNYENSHLDSITRDRDIANRIEQGIRDGRRLRAEVLISAIGKVRHHFAR